MGTRTPTRAGGVVLFSRSVIGLLIVSAIIVAIFQWGFVEGISVAIPLPPHSVCLWQAPNLRQEIVAGDVMTAIAYAVIPAMLGWVAWMRRADLAWTSPILWGFSLFIILCGTAHAIAVGNMYVGGRYYWWYAHVGLLRGFVSLGVMFQTWQILPVLRRLKTPSQLEAIAEEQALLVRQLSAQLELVQVSPSQLIHLRDSLVRLGGVGQKMSR